MEGQAHLLTRAVPPPGAVNIGHEDVHPMFGILLVFLFGLEHERLEDGVVACDDADGEHLVAAAVLFAAAADAQPVPAVVNCVCGI